MSEGKPTSQQLVSLVERQAAQIEDQAGRIGDQAAQIERQGVS